ESNNLRGYRLSDVVSRTSDARTNLEDAIDASLAGEEKSRRSVDSRLSSTQRTRRIIGYRQVFLPVYEEFVEPMREESIRMIRAVNDLEIFLKFAKLSSK
uniref:hypothetical protein n=1 Tax=Acinetobacter indicus TaxID=756892 RepID=UPI001C08E1DF